MTAEVDEGIGGVSRLARLISLGRLAPGGLADAPFALAAAAAVRVVHRIHCHAPRLFRQRIQDRKPKDATNQSGPIPNHVHSPCPTSAQARRPGHKRNQKHSPGQVKRILGRCLCFLCASMAAGSSWLKAGQKSEIRTSPTVTLSIMLQLSLPVMGSPACNLIRTTQNGSRHAKRKERVKMRLLWMRTVGRLPDQRAAPAFPSLRFLCCGLLSAPTVARHAASTRRCSPDGSRTVAYPSAPAPPLYF